jgi:hypothetical protein
MTPEQRRILNELAEFAPILKERKCKDFIILKTDFADLKSYLYKNSCGEVIVSGVIDINLSDVIHVRYGQSKAHIDYYYVQVIIKRK